MQERLLTLAFCNIFIFGQIDKDKNPDTVLCKKGCSHLLSVTFLSLGKSIKTKNPSTLNNFNFLSDVLIILNILSQDRVSHTNLIASPCLTFSYLLYATFIATLCDLNYFHISRDM